MYSSLASVLLRRLTNLPQKEKVQRQWLLALPTRKRQVNLGSLLEHMGARMPAGLLEKRYAIEVL